MRRMNKNILLAVAAYYIHRDNARPPGLLDVRPRYEWDKKKDLDFISALCTKAGFGFEACAGTFWFKKNGRSYQMNERSWPNFVKGDTC